MDERAPDVGRFYTQIRRFKKMLGRFHDGTPIPGGPYTLAQGIFGVVAMFVLIWTNPLWATGVDLLDLVLGLLIVWGVAWLSGKLPSTKRNMLIVAMDASSAAFAPLTGKYKGQTINIRPPHRAFVRGQTTPRLPRLGPAPAEPAVTVAEVEPPSVPVRLELTTGSAVQRLLAQTKSH